MADLSVAAHRLHGVTDTLITDRRSFCRHDAPSFRIAVVALMAIFSPFVLTPLGDSVVPWLLETPQRVAWTAFGFLLFVELGALAVGVVLHRSAKHESAPADT